MSQTTDPDCFVPLPELTAFTPERSVSLPSPAVSSHLLLERSLASVAPQEREHELDIVQNYFGYVPVIFTTDDVRGLSRSQCFDLMSSALEAYTTIHPQATPYIFAEDGNIEADFYRLKKSLLAKAVTHHTHATRNKESRHQRDLLEKYLGHVPAILKTGDLALSRSDHITLMSAAVAAFAACSRAEGLSCVNVGSKEADAQLLAEYATDKAVSVIGQAVGRHARYLDLVSRRMKASQKDVMIAFHFVNAGGGMVEHIYPGRPQGLPTRLRVNGVWSPRYTIKRALLDAYTSAPDLWVGHTFVKTVDLNLSPQTRHHSMVVAPQEPVIH